MAAKPVIYHIPVCPFSQRVEILLALKGLAGEVDFHVVDITKPRDPRLIELARGSTALPVMETSEGVIKESLVILRYIEERFDTPPVARRDAHERAAERMLIAMENDFTTAGYRLLMNQDPGRRHDLLAAVREQYRKIDDFLRWQNPEGVYLFETFGLAETVFTPLFMRFWFLDYYEKFELPPQGYERVLAWREACLRHDAAQQVGYEEIVKLYYDYARGAGNGALPEGRAVSSFAFHPDWKARPWPPRDKYGHAASDAELGLA